MTTKRYLRTILAGTVSAFALANAAAAANSAASADSSQSVQEIKLVVAHPGPDKKSGSAYSQDQQPGATGLVRLAQAGGNTVARADTTAATESVTVTGSRIANGAAMPTPVTVVFADQLNIQTPTSIPEALAQLPMFAPTLGTTSHTEPNGRGFGTPTNNLNLHGLGAIRTLILMDGNRVPGTFYDTTVNVDMLPQMLVQRVDVVTGGASAVYGSDAVAGVVNYVLDHKFMGFKAQIQAGTSTYGDADTARVGFAAGFNLLNDKGHFEMSAEYFNRDSINDSAARPYGDLAHACSTTGSFSSSTNPQVLACNIRQSNVSPFGLITSGPKKGLQFSADGKAIIAFDPGTATGTGNTSYGGDGGVLHNQTIISADHNGQAYGRFDYDFSDRLSFYADARYGASYTSGASQGYTNTDVQYPIWLYSGNAYFTAAQQAALFPTGTTSVDIGRFNNDLGRQLNVKQATNTEAVSAGLKGATFGDFTWDVHYTHGQNAVTLTTINNMNTSRFYAAIDAVVDPSTGNTVCRSSIATPGAFPGCVPLNVLGQGNSTAAAQQYVFGTTGWQAKNKMDDFTANLTGTLFEGWAGPIKTAVGMEYRHQALKVITSEPNGVTFNPQNLRLGAAGNSATASFPSANLAWFKEVQSGAIGAEDISEADIELQVPLLKDLPFAQFVSLNGAYRYAAYSTNGLVGAGSVSSTFSANTYKLGLEWSVNDDLRFRASTSRDMRAPTLWDLYQQQVITTSGISDAAFCDPKAPAGANCVGTGLSGSINTVTGGNPKLKPETSINNTAGVVFTPSFIPGFTASIDYYHVKIGNAIGAIGGNSQAAYQLCLESNLTSPYCNLIQRPLGYTNQTAGNFPTQITSLNQNVSLNSRGGFDTEIDYVSDLSSWTSMNGFMNFRLFWNHQEVSGLVSVASLPGALYQNNVNTFGTPRDRANISLGYSYEGFSATVTEQFIAQQNWFATTNPPTPRFIKDGPIPAYYLTGLAMTYDFDVESQPVTGFLNINNLFNNPGPVVGGFGGGSPGFLYPTPTYADIIGRYFTLGFRVKM
jgi:iron complex outermembrane receptor protein